MESVFIYLSALMTSQSESVGSPDAAATGDPTATGATGGGGGGIFDGSLTLFILLGVMILIFWLLIIRPQRKQQKELRNKVESIQKGDRVLTSAGFQMKVTNIREHSVIAELGEGRDNSVRVEVGKQFIHNVIKDSGGAFSDDSRDSDSK